MLGTGGMGRLPALQAKGRAPNSSCSCSRSRVEVMAGNGFRGSELTYLVADEGVQVPVLGAIADALPRCERPAGASGW